MKRYTGIFIFFACFQYQANLVAQIIQDATQLGHLALTSKIKWNATSFIDLNSGVNVTNSCYFVTQGLQKIEWAQMNGQVIYSFLVRGTTQDGNDVTDRLIGYDVKLETLEGRIDFFKRVNGIVVLVDLVSTSGDVIRNEYQISTIENLPL